MSFEGGHYHHRCHEQEEECHEDFLLISQKKIFFDPSIIKVLFKVLICSFLMAILVENLISTDIISFTEKHFSAKKNLSLLMTILFGAIAYILMIFISGIKEINFLKWKK